MTVGRVTTENDAYFVKDPSAILDFTEDWGTYWTATGETLSTLSVTADTGITVESSAIVSDTYATAWLSGGTAGKTYEVKFTVTTSESRTDVRRMYIRVRNR